MTDFETLAWAAKETLELQQNDWLNKAMIILREDFKQLGESIPSIIFIHAEYPPVDMGSYWLGAYFEGPHDSLIYINPMVDGLTALDILVHELVHAVVGVEDVHGERFWDVATAVGLNGNGDTTGAGKVLLKRLREIQEILGSYPFVFDFLEEA
jgi:hypothetical protein